MTSKFRTGLRRDDGLNDKQATRLGRGLRHRSLGNLPATAMVRGLKRAGLMDHANHSFLNQGSVRIACALRHASCRATSPPWFLYNSAFPSMTRYQGRSTIHQGMPADEQRSKWSKMALTVVAVGGKCRGGGPMVYVPKRRCYHIDFLLTLWPYLLCCAK